MREAARRITNGRVLTHCKLVSNDHGGRAKMYERHEFLHSAPVNHVRVRWRVGRGRLLL